MIRNRKKYLFLIILTIAFGLFSRSKFIPIMIYPYLGDYLYALMCFFIFGFIFIKKEPYKITIISIAVCYLIELLQLYQSDWINNIRDNEIGGLILGYGFLWSDILSYTLGGITGCFLELNHHKQK